MSFDDPFTVESDPEAPYGRKPDGTPYKMSAEARQAAADRMTAGRQAKAAQRRAGGDTLPPLSPSGGRPRPAGKKATEKKLTRADAAKSMLQLPAMLLGFAARIGGALREAGRIKGNWVEPVGLDSITVSLHAANLADAAEQFSFTNRALGAVLDRAAKVSPGMDLATALLPLLAQFAVNHGMAPPVAELGTMAPQDLLAAAGIPFDVDAAAAAEQAFNGHDDIAG